LDCVPVTIRRRLRQIQEQWTELSADQTP
jgi:hypothetical protein